MQYFPSIDRAILKQKLRRRLKDKSVLWLFDLLIDQAPASVSTVPAYFPGDDLLAPASRVTGLPIGNLTSQFLANLYLDDLDHYIKETLKVRAYLRYVDDMILLDNDKRRLHRLRQQIAERLQLERLRSHPRKAHVMPVSRGVDVLGYRVFPAARRLRNENGHRFARKLRRLALAWCDGDLRWPEVDASVQSWIAHARHADTRGLRQAIFSDIVFQRASAAR